MEILILGCKGSAHVYLAIIPFFKYRHLISDRSIEELQQQNQKLLGVIRELSEEKEKKEGEDM